MALSDRLVSWAIDRARVLRRIERRELAEFRRWAENTQNLLHLTVLVALPVILGVVTAVSTSVDLLPFLLFPPLASGGYTLFANPESEYASPRRFVAGITTGALCGWVAFEVAARYWYGVPTAEFGVHPGAVAFGLFLTGAVTWALDIEEASAFSAALLVHVTGTSQFAYVVSVFVSTSLVAAVFVVWRGGFYERRAQFLYGTTQSDDHVLVPMRGDTAETTARFGARLAASHEAGKVVLLSVVDADGDAVPVDRFDDDGPVTETAARLESHADSIRAAYDVPCEVVVASGDPTATTFDTARQTNCDLVVTPYEEERGLLSEYVRSLFRGPYDAIAFRSNGNGHEWNRILVTVSRPGDSAHAMMDFATRLADDTGSVSVCTCIDREVERRPAENRLANIVEGFDGPIETRVARTAITDFIAANADAYDLVVIGSSGDRSAASRFVSPPTFERIQSVDCDVAVVDRGEPGEG